ncbi:hypothetical protein Ae201684P_022188 [Aphanomyces euteiches]|nr:hypothetical protein Ae201684P_015516 [Aphanomyces euteiches]KAH9071754.1 hypothetical protein Ae201684P_020194 [Aphanomyces euteiches]KAH9095110.1 hypothetical protein Ae201684P_022188 [Aphanomyces euteiches]
MPSKPARLTLAQKDAIRDFARTLQTINMKDLGKWIHDNFSISVHRKTISTILNDTRCLDDACIDSDVATKRYNLKAPINVGLDRELLIWINKCDAMNVSITGDLIKEQALAIYETQPSPKKPMHFSSGWLYCFMKRHDLTSRRLHGERASLSQDEVDDGRSKLLLETSRYSKEDIYNMDESALFYKRAPDTTISKTATQGLKKDKTRITVALAANCSGSDKLPLLFIGKAARPRCFGNKSAEQLCFIYRFNRKAWMTITIFSEWISKFNAMMATMGRSVLLVLDNASSHKIEEVELTHVRVLMLPPNATSALQPMDAGVIAAFKRYFKRKQLRHAIQRVNRVPDDKLKDFKKLGSKIYAVDQLTAMNWAKSAWDDVTPETIKNCWLHTGIVQAD